MQKIVIIGAGSLVFSSRLTADILSWPALEDCHIALVDIDGQRLGYAKRIVERMFQEGGYSRATVSATTDRTEALSGAGFVIVSILVGGYEAIQSEIDIPKAFGIDQCIGDTLTPGGIMRCLRTLPDLEAIARDVQRFCPSAYVLNYTNPMGMLSWGMTDAVPSLRYVGLCHSVQGTGGEWAKRLGIPFSEVDFQCQGINHQAWFLEYRHKGVDMLPRIRELALDPSIWHGDSTRMEYVKHLGYPVTESSGHVSEYNWWFRKNELTISRYCRTEHSDWNGGHGFIKKLYDRPDWQQRMEKMASWETPVSLQRSKEYGSAIINAIVTGERVVVHGSVKNHGAIPNLAWDSIVEVPCMVDRNGIQAVQCRPLPLHLAAVNRMQQAVQELAVRAVQQGDPELVFQAMALDPLTAMSCTLDEIREMTRTLMQAHSAWIACMNGRLPASKPVLYTSAAPVAVERHEDPAEANKTETTT